MQFLHKRSVVHGDLRSPNLLLDYMVERGQPRFHIRIADFGLAQMLKPTMSNVSVSKHTNPRWAAPEVIKQSQLSRPADVYSFGVVMWELLTWQQPYEDMKSVQVIYSATQLHKRPEVPDDGALPGRPGATLAEYKHLMEVCWADDAEERPSFSQILDAMDHMREQETQPPAARRPDLRAKSIERLHSLVAPGAATTTGGGSTSHSRRSSLELLLQGGSPPAGPRGTGTGAAALATTSPFMTPQVTGRTGEGPAAHATAGRPTTATATAAWGTPVPGTSGIGASLTGGDLRQAGRGRPASSPFAQSLTGGLVATTPGKASDPPFLWAQPVDGAPPPRQPPAAGLSAVTGESAGSYRTLPTGTTQTSKASRVTGSSQVTGSSTNSSCATASHHADPRASLVDLTPLLPCPQQQHASPSSSLTVSPNPAVFHPLHTHLTHPTALPPPIPGASHMLLPHPPQHQLFHRSTSTSSVDTSSNSLTHWPTLASNPNPFANTRPLIPLPSTEATDTSGVDGLHHSISLPNMGQGSNGGGSRGGAGSSSGRPSRPAIPSVELPLIRLDSDPVLTPRQAEQILAGGGSGSSHANHVTGGGAGGNSSQQQQQPAPPHSHSVMDDEAVSSILSEAPLSFLEAERILSGTTGSEEPAGERADKSPSLAPSLTPSPGSGGPKPPGSASGRTTPGRLTRTLVSPFAMPMLPDVTL